MKLRQFILFVLTFHISTLTSAILTTSNFSDIEAIGSTLESNSLVLFDVDATLIVPDDAILKPHVKKLFFELVTPYKNRDLFRAIRMKAKHSLVDPKIPGFVEALHSRQIPVIAFTAAPAKIDGDEEPCNWRIDELNRYGFDFSASLPIETTIHFPRNPAQAQYPVNADTTQSPMYKSGILFTAFHRKGGVLVVFLKELELKPNHVLFVDDELHQVESVVTALEAQGIQCTGVHYTAVINSPCEINVEHARRQITHFIEHDIWINDQGET